MTLNILIYGAGAIGRGYLPWILTKNAKISYVEDNLNFVNYLKHKFFLYIND